MVTDSASIPNTHPKTVEDQRMSKNALKQAITDLILSRGNVTFAELDSVEGFRGIIVHFFNVGDLNAEVILWEGVSREASDALDELLTDRVIAASTCNSFLYLIDGLSLKLPVLPPSMASRKAPFRKLRTYWAPLQFSPFARVKEADRLPVRFRPRPTAGP